MALKKFNAVSGFSVGDDVIFDVIDDAANVSANNLTVTALSNLGDVSNVKITGGTNGQYLQTDGTGNLFWTSGTGGGGTGTPGGVTTEVQFNDSGSFAGDTGFTYNKTTNTLNVDGAYTRNGKNVPTYTASLTAPSSPKMGDYWYDSNNDIIYQYIYDGTSSAWVDTTSGFISSAITPSAGFLVQRDVNGNIYGNGIIGTFLQVTGNVSANYFVGNGSQLTHINGSNVGGQVSNALVSGTVYSNAQPNITSVGTLTDLSVTGNASVGNILTDHILYSNGSPYIFTVGAVGSNTEVQFNDNGSFSASANFTFDTGYNSGAGLLSIGYGNGGAIKTDTLTISGVSNLGPLSNVKISGGYSGYVLTTDGSGNLTWSASAGGPGSGFISINRNNFTGDGSTKDFTLSSTPGSIQDLVVNINGLIQLISSYTLSGSLLSFATPPLLGEKIEVVVYEAVSLTGTDKQVQFNDAGQFGASSAFTFDKTSNVLAVTGNISATYFTGNGAFLTGLPSSYANSNVASYLPTYTGNISANYYSGNGSELTNINGANITGNVSQAVHSYYADVANSVSGSNVSGNVSQAVHAYYSDVANSVAGANVSGQVSNALIAGTVYTNAQPNITSVGTLTSLSVTGNITGGNITTSGILSTTNSTNSTGTGTGALIVSGGASVTKDLWVGGTIHAPNIQFTNSTTLDANVPLLYLNASTPYPYSYELGFYSRFDKTGSDYQHTGLIRNHSNDEWYLVSNVSEPSGGTIDLANANVVYDTLRIGNIKSYGYANITGNVSANYFVGNGSTITFITGSNVNGNVSQAVHSYYSDVANSVAGANVSGNVSQAVHAYYADVANSVAGANVNGQVSNALIAGTVYTNAQPNITSVGTLTSLSVTGNVSANYFVGNGATLTNITGANVSGNVSQAVHSYYSDVANTVSGSNVTGQVANALIAGTVYTNSQPNITSVGTLTSLNVNGNVNITGSISSNKANITVTTNTVIDQFATSSYRSAKYHISAKGTNGYQSAEVLLVHDGSNSFITIYGSICSNSVADIVDFSSNIVSSNVVLYATTGSASTTVNLIPLYITD